MCLSFTAQNGVLIKCLSIKSFKVYFQLNSVIFMIFIVPFLDQLSFHKFQHFSTFITNFQDNNFPTYPALSLSSSQPVDVHCSSLPHLLLLFIFVNLFLSLSFIFESPHHSLSLCLGEK